MLEMTSCCATTTTAIHRSRIRFNHHPIKVVFFITCSTHECSERDISYNCTGPLQGAASNLDPENLDWPGTILGSDGSGVVTSRKTGNYHLPQRAEFIEDYINSQRYQVECKNITDYGIQFQN